MRLLRLVAPILAVLLVPVARADTYTTFNVSGAAVQGFLNGTLTLDSTTGLFTASNLTVSYGAETFSFRSTPTLFVIPKDFADGPYAQEIFNNASSDVLDITFPAGDLTGYTGGMACSQVAICAEPGPPATSAFQPGPEVSDIESDDTFDDVVLSAPAAQTPEPPALWLTCLGALCGASVRPVRRRGARGW